MGAIGDDERGLGQDLPAPGPADRGQAIQDAFVRNVGALFAQRLDTSDARRRVLDLVPAQQRQSRYHRLCSVLDADLLSFEVVPGHSPAVFARNVNNLGAGSGGCVENDPFGILVLLRRHYDPGTRRDYASLLAGYLLDRAPEDLGVLEAE